MQSILHYITTLCKLNTVGLLFTVCGTVTCYIHVWHVLHTALGMTTRFQDDDTTDDLHESTESYRGDAVNRSLTWSGRNRRRELVPVGSQSMRLPSITQNQVQMYNTRTTIIHLYTGVTANILHRGKMLAGILFGEILEIHFDY